MSTMQRLEGRSLFWPLVLIGVGLVWLLSNLGVLQPASISILFRLWPLVLIIIGLDLLFGRQSPILGTLIGVGGVALLIVLMLVGPSLGWVSSADVKEASFSEPVGDASSASVTLDLSVASTTIRALTDSDTLFDADLRYLGTVDFTASGGGEKTIHLRQTGETSTSTSFWDWGWFNSDQNLRWNIGLNPDIPTSLTVNSGVGTSTFNLSDIQLTHLQINSGVGSLDLILPAPETSYMASIRGGVGSVTLTIPSGAAVRLEATSGVGAITVPSIFTRISGDEDNFLGDEGVWETSGFDSADQKITIQYNGGVDSLTVR